MINRINFSKNNYKIIKILNPYKEKVSTQFVGGYVRKLIEGISSNDVDLASNLKIDLLKKILIKNNIKIFNINLKYQTIKFFYKNNLYEVTSLRKDLYSYHGRHAIIEETNNWMSDAFRRDFTINAIYCDINKNLFDPFNGKHDLLNKRLVFIGNPEIRIKEDYTRIIRFIRFSLEYSVNKDLRKNLFYINKNIVNLKKNISTDRLFIELKKLINLNFFLNIIKYPHFQNILKKIYNIVFFSRLKKLKLLKDNYKVDFYQILLILLIGKKKHSTDFCRKFNLSYKISKKFNDMYLQIKLLNKKNYDNYFIKKQLYYYGKEFTKDFLFLFFCANKHFSLKKLNIFYKYIDKTYIPKFPITGNFLINKKNFVEGKDLGIELKKIENKWIKNNFKLKNLFI
jgi:poly(A) polymerase